MAKWQNVPAGALVNPSSQAVLDGEMLAWDEETSGLISKTYYPINELGGKKHILGAHSYPRRQIV